MQIDIRKFVQRHWELWPRLYPGGVKVTMLTAEQRGQIHQQINREFGLTAEASEQVRASLMNSPDAVLIRPFVDSSPTLENLMTAANTIAAGVRFALPLVAFPLMCERSVSHDERKDMSEKPQISGFANAAFRVIVVL
jgi:hypothetical protein